MVLQETVAQPERPQGAEGLGGAAGRADRQQGPVGGGRSRVGRRPGGDHRRPTAVRVGQLAGPATATTARRRRLGGRPSRRTHRPAAARRPAQPVARLRQQSPRFATAAAAATVS